MKSTKIIYLEKILRFFAKTILKKYNPTVVGITGSVGKSSTKEAVFNVLSLKFRTRKNEKNYNNEIGLPLTIIGSESGNSSIWKWIKVFFKGLFAIIFPIKYPEILVLEMGVDRPGDMEYLLSFINPTVGIITNISGSHLEFFKSIDHILKEKGKLVKNLSEGGLAILNSDDEKSFSFKDKLKNPAALFGFGDNAEIKASDINFNFNNFQPQGISFKLNFEGKIIPIRLPYVLAPHLIYSALAAIAVGNFFKINLVDIADALQEFSPPPGRMNLIKGIKESYVIDDTYNSSPTSTLAALDVMNDLKAIRKIAALGDMLELGESSDEKHREVLMHASKKGVTIFFIAGDRMKKAAGELEMLRKISGRVFYFDDPEYLGIELKKGLRKGDLVLVKGSQGIRMEKIVKELMEEPLRAKELLVRQTGEWENK